MLFNFAESVRPVFFHTDDDEYVYATHGGTLFLVAYRGRPYAVTCAHVFGDFRWQDLVVAKTKLPVKGTRPGKIRSIAYPSRPYDGAIGSDITDLCVISFTDDVAPDFFSDIYPLSEDSIANSKQGDRLLAAGFLKEKTALVPPDMTLGFCRLEFQDDGPYDDPFLRRAVAGYLNPEFDDLAGMSGSPVFDLTTDRLCGMVVRGGMNEGRCRVYFMDASDILNFVAAVHDKTANVHYRKTRSG